MKKSTLCFLGTFFVSMFIVNSVEGQKLNKKLTNYSASVITEFDQIPAERKEILRQLGNYIFEKQAGNETTKITVICTHNSRRSHMGQLWLYAASTWYGMQNLHIFSGGTEATAFHPNAVATLKRAGFYLSKASGTENPTYKATYLKGRGNQTGSMMFSKKYDHNQNPKENFAALMVCSEADESCPVVPGAEERFSLPFDDPRYSDGTASEELTYDKANRMIAREMFFAVNHAKEQMILAMEKQK